MNANDDDEYLGPGVMALNINEDEKGKLLVRVLKGADQNAFLYY